MKMTDELLESKIEKIYENKTTGGKGFRVIEMSGQRYSVWETDWQFSKGDVVKYRFSEKDNFKNITYMEVIESTAPKSKPEQYRDNNSTILRSVSLKAATRLVSKNPDEMSLEEQVRKIVNIADIFELYLTWGNQKNVDYDMDTETKDDVPF